MRKLLFATFVLTLVLTTSSCKIFSKTSGDGLTKTKSGLKYQITQKGNGSLAKKGDIVQVHYKGMFTDDKVFDSSYDRGEPFEFELGAGRVIKGWDEGIALLHVGDKATFIIPPQLAYGSRQTGPIPPDSWLVFEVELIAIK